MAEATPPDPVDSAEEELVVDPPRILVVDDERVIREILCEFLAMEGYAVSSAEDGAKALSELRIRPYDIVISDLKMPNVSGIELLEKIKQEEIQVLTIIMTGFGTVETAIEAMKKGAYDYILKPFKVEEVIHIVQRGLERQRLQNENVRLKEALTLYRVSEAIATSLDLDHILDVILSAAMGEVGADVATLHLKDPDSGHIEERVRVTNDNGQSIRSGTLPSPDIQLMLRSLGQGSPILAHGHKAGRFFTSQSGDKALVSFTAVPLQVAGRVIGMLNVFSFTTGKKFDEGSRKVLTILASRAASTIENARLYDDLVSKNAALLDANTSLEENFQQTVVGFAHALEESDRYTRGHSERVALYSELIAQGLTLPDAECQTIVKAGLMHDIGKIGIRYEMLNKPGKLTPEEVQVFRAHPAKGKRILEPIPCMRHLVNGCWCHHERFDGNGYPRELSRQDIPIMGRVVAVADAYDAMTSDRAYRRALPHKVAVEEIQRCSGSQFDPEIAKVFLNVIETFRTEARERGELTLVPD